MLTLGIVLSIAAPSAFAQATGRQAFLPDSLHLQRISTAAALAGEIQACELEWEPYYLGYMQSERRRASHEGWPQEKVAFIGAFFGAVQGRTLEEYRDQPCPAEKVAALIERVRAVMSSARAHEGAAGASP